AAKDTANSSRRSQPEPLRQTAQRWPVISSWHHPTRQSEPETGCRRRTSVWINLSFTGLSGMARIEKPDGVSLRRPAGFTSAASPWPESVRRGTGGNPSFAGDLKFGIAEDAHFGAIQTFDLNFLADAQRANEVAALKPDVGHDESKHRHDC